MSDVSKTSFGTVFAIWVAGLCAAGQFAKVSVSYGALAEVYPDAGAALGLTVSLISGMGMVLGAVAGQLVAGLGFRPVLVWGLCLGAAMSFAQATDLGFGLFLATRFLEGLSHLAIVVAAPTLIAKVTASKHHPAAMTLWSCFFGVAFAGTAWFGAPIVANHGPGPLFVLHGIACCVMAGVLALLLPKDDTAEVSLPSFAKLLTNQTSVYGSPFTSSPALGWLFYTITFVGLLTLLPDMLGPQRGIALIGVLPLISIISSFTLGVQLLHRCAAFKVLMAGFVGSAIAMAVFLLWPDRNVAFYLLAISWGLVQGAGFAMVPQLNSTTEDRARANGALAQMGNLGNLVGTPVLAIVLVTGGPAAVAVTLGVLYGIGFLVQLFLRRMRQHNGVGN
ncbi:MAG: MFS transporter [Pseudoruegeria sp.]